MAVNLAWSEYQLKQEIILTLLRDIHDATESLLILLKDSSLGSGYLQVAIFCYCKGPRKILH